MSYMFDQRHKWKIKNDKIMQWRVELSCYSFDIVYCPWERECISWCFFSKFVSCCSEWFTVSTASVTLPTWYHKDVAFHPGTKLTLLCCECKPRYHRPAKSHLIKATQPFERLNIDFKGPLPSNNKNVYFLNIIEYSRFLFVFLCPYMNTSTVIKCWSLLFTLFRMPAFVHSDRGPTLVSRELRSYLTGKGVAVSRTTPYILLVTDKWKSIMELYGESSLWLVDPRIYPSNIGRMFSPMRSIPYDLFFVLLPMGLHTSASSISPIISRLDAQFPLGWPSLGLYTSSAMCEPARRSLWSMR